jgi:hypothetical protein
MYSLKWSGTPFATAGVYKVAKYGAPVMYIGIRGGVNALKKMDPEQIKARTIWQLSSQKKSSDWINSDQFCSILEDKGIRYD